MRVQIQGSGPQNAYLFKDFYQEIIMGKPKTEGFMRSMWGRGLRVSREAHGFEYYHYGPLDPKDPY